MDLRPVDPRERGRLAEIGPEDVLRALAAARTGRLFDLDCGRFNGMAQWDGHPKFMITSFRTPGGVRAARDVPLLETGNDESLGFFNELLVSCMHIGTHIDALCHITCGDEDTWHGGWSASHDVGDSGPTRCDAAAIPPIVLPGVLLDVAGHLQTQHLEPGSAVSAETLRETATTQGTSVLPGSCVLVRTGAMSRWPDPQAFDAVCGAGPDLEAARWLADEAGVALAGSDTPTFEQVPTTSPTNPHPVHELLIRQRGIHLLENVYLEELAAERVHTFCLVVLPLKIAGATASMVRPIAIA